MTNKQLLAGVLALLISTSTAHAADKLKIVYWDETGFCLWYKRLEKHRFKWPRKVDDAVLTLSEEQLHWLLRGLDITRMRVHEPLYYHAT